MSEASFRFLDTTDKLIDVYKEALSNSSLSNTEIHSLKLMVQEDILFFEKCLKDLTNG